MNHKNNIVKKPWGYEYLVYENENVALWFLHIDYDQQTSMHCHPNKTTGLILLNGRAELSFLADKRQLDSLDKVMIRRGLFHQTKALSKEGIDLFEIETPNDKNDLVRLKDRYGRENKVYEGSESEIPKNEECLWLNGNNITENFKKCNISVFPISSLLMLQMIHDESIIVFLKGGMIRKTQDNRFHLVTVPGDVGFAKIIKQVANELDDIHPETLIMIINK